MADNSRTLAILAIAGLVLLSGCSALVTGNNPVEFAADPAGVDDATLSETNYELANSEESTINRTVSIAEEERTVIITNHMKTFEKQSSNSKSTGLFAVFSTPSAEVAGQAVNPIATVSNDRLVDLVTKQSDSGSINDVEKVDEYNLTVNGDQTTVTKYEGTTTVEGQKVDVYIHLTKMQMDSDTVVAVGIYPKLTAEQSSDEMDALMQGLEHE